MNYTYIRILSMNEKGMPMKKVVLTLVSLLTLSFSAIPTASAAEDVYANYEELAAHHQLGEDYDIATQSTGNDVIILGIHGGKIEIGTSEIVKAVAQTDHSYYLFEAKISLDSNSIQNCRSRRPYHFQTYVGPEYRLL